MKIACVLSDLFGCMRKNALFRVIDYVFNNGNSYGVWIFLTRPVKWLSGAG